MGKTLGQSFGHFYLASFMFLETNKHFLCLCKSIIITCVVSCLFDVSSRDSGFLIRIERSDMCPCTSPHGSNQLHAFLHRRIQTHAQGFSKLRHNVNKSKFLHQSKTALTIFTFISKIKSSLQLDTFRCTTFESCKCITLDQLVHPLEHI